MIYYKCDCCGYEINESGTVRNFVSNEKHQNMYQIKSIHEDNSDTLNGLVFCHDCLSRMCAKSMESPEPFGRIMDKLDSEEEDDDNKSYVRFKCPKCGAVFKLNKENNFPSTGIICFCGTKIDTSNGKESVEMFKIFDPITDRFDDQVKYQCPVCYKVFSRKFLSSKYCNHKTFVCNCGQRLDNPEYDGGDDEKTT